MSSLSSVESEALLKAPAFEVGLRAVPERVSAFEVGELSRRGLVEVQVRWRRTDRGDRLAEEIADRKRRVA